MNPDEISPPREMRGQIRNRQSGGVGGKHDGSRHSGFGLFDRVGFNRRVFEYRLDHKINIVKGYEIRCRCDAGQKRFALSLGSPTLQDAARDDLIGRRLAFIGGGLITVDQHDVDTGECRNGGDACSHKASTNNTDTAQRGCGLTHGTTGTFVERLHRDKQSADHRFGDFTLEDMGKIAAFYP